MSDDMNADKATQLTRKFLQDNYGNISMLLYRIESVNRNNKENIYKVCCSLLPSIGASERIFYLLKIDISKGVIEDVSIGKEEIKDGEKVIVLRKRVIKEESE